MMTVERIPRTAEVIDLPGPRQGIGVRRLPSQRLGVRETDQTAVVVPLLSDRAVRISGEGCCRPGTGCSGGGWLVTAPHQQPASASSERAPWGIFHFKQNGGLLTACGEYAVAWHVFWGLEVNPLERQACRVCVRVTLGQFGDSIDRPEDWS
jgi:hypothetical protein